MRTKTESFCCLTDNGTEYNGSSSSYSEAEYPTFLMVLLSVSLVLNVVFVIIICNQHACTVPCDQKMPINE